MGFENNRPSLNLVGYVFVLYKGKKELDAIQVTLHNSGHCRIQSQAVAKEDWSSRYKIYRKMPLICEYGIERLKKRLTKKVFEGEYKNK